MNAHALRLLFPVLLLLGGCAATPQQQISTLELFRAVQVPEGRARVFLQHGRIVHRLDEFSPHCSLEIRHLHGPPRTIHPGLYRVSRVERVVTEVVMSGPGVRLVEAGVGIGIRWGSFGFHRVDDDLPPDIFEGYHYWLQDTGDGLLRLSCFGARGLPAEARPPTLAELAETLGPYGRLSVHP